MSATPVRFALLGMLSLHPMTGYEMKLAFEQGPANFMPISFGQIYPLLAQLSRQKLARKEKSQGARGSIRYSITAAGAKALREWLFTPTQPMPHRELLLRVFFATPAELPRLRSIIEKFRDEETRRQEHYRATRKWLHQAQARSPRLPVWELVLGFGISQNQARLRWAGKALASIPRFKQEKKI